MFARSNAWGRWDELDAELGCTEDATPELLAKVIRSVGVPSAAVKSTRINRLVAAEAWTEAALALIELELPRWRLRRLILEDGGWLCTLSRQWKLPDWLDDTVEARHRSLPLAILGALIAARRCGDKAERSASSVPRCPIEISRDATVCCDNFA